MESNNPTAIMLHIATCPVVSMETVTSVAVQTVHTARVCRQTAEPDDSPGKESALPQGYPPRVSPSVRHDRPECPPTRQRLPREKQVYRLETRGHTLLQYPCLPGTPGRNRIASLAGR